MRENKVRLIFVLVLLAIAVAAFGAFRLLRRSSVVPTDQARTANKAAEADALGGVSAAAPAQVTPVNPEQSPPPKLPLVDFDACGSPNPNSGEPLPYKLEADDDLYSSWQEDRTLVGRLSLGTEVTRVGAVNIIRKPDRGVITGEVDESLRPLVRGDEVLGYGLHSDSFISFWGKGVSFTEYFENIAEKGSCGFADKTQCRINITQRGDQEWWMQLRTGGGVTGWVMGAKFTGDNPQYGPNAGYACRD
jgi:hypothetical protein